MSLDQNLENRVREITDALDTSIFEAYQASSNLNASLIREEVFRLLSPHASYKYQIPSPQIQKNSLIYLPDIFNLLIQGNVYMMG